MTVCDGHDACVAAATQAFVDTARRLLASEDEALRRQLEDRLLVWWPALRAAGVLEVFEIRDPVLRRMLEECAVVAD